MISSRMSEVVPDLSIQMKMKTNQAKGGNGGQSAKLNPCPHSPTKPTQPKNHMRHVRIFILAAAYLLTSGCKTPEAGHVMSELDGMVGTEVLVTTSHSVALWPGTRGTGKDAVYDTATYLKATLKSVDPAGIVLIVGNQKVWLGRESIVSVASLE